MSTLNRDHPCNNRDVYILHTHASYMYTQIMGLLDRNWKQTQKIFNRKVYTVKGSPNWLLGDESNRNKICKLGLLIQVEFSSDKHVQHLLYIQLRVTHGLR